MEALFILYVLTYTMKKTLLSLAGIVALSTILWWAVSAQVEISDLFYDGAPIVDGAHTRLLNEYDRSRWYLNTSVDCSANNWITITSPVVEDAEIDRADIYNLFISPYRMDQIRHADSSVDTSRILMWKVEIGDGSENVKFEISPYDLDPSTIYYGFVSPVNMFDVVGTPSKEICFKIDSNMCLQDTSCDSIEAMTTPTWWDEIIEQHGAACVGMDLANVTHVINGDTLTLKWTAVDGDVVEIGVWDREAENYKSLWTAKMSDEKFDYKIEEDWEQNFQLTNGCKEFYYKADAKKWEKTPEKIVTPATGPAENVLYIAIAAIVLYGAYVIFFRKADNK